MSSCRWPVEHRCLPEHADPIALEEAVNTAVGVLWALTGRRFGTCLVRVRPCPTIDIVSPRWASFLEPSSNPTVTCLTARCARQDAILLPGPVHELVGFTVGGENIAVDSLVLEGDRIRRREGLAWPVQNLSRPVYSDDTWSVSYLRGTPPPAGAAHAVGVLAREFYDACTTGRCRLPRRTTQVQRQGVTVSMVDPSDIYASGATGITEVDLWIRAHNPHRLAAPVQVWSPDQEVW